MLRFDFLLNCFQKVLSNTHALPLCLIGGYAILPPKQERDILLGEFEDLEDLWGSSIVEVNVSFSKKICA